MKKVIVTGSNGFLGKNLVKNLLENNYFVYSIVRNSQKKIYLKSPNHKYIYSNLSDTNILVDYFKNKDIDTFFHLAWPGSRGQLRFNSNVQIQAAQLAVNMYRFSNELSIPKFLVTGTISEKLVESCQYQNTRLTEYAISKYATRIFLSNLSKTYKTKLIYAQLSNLYGSDPSVNNLIQLIINKLSKKEEVELTKCNQPYDFMYVDDCAEALRLLSEKDLSKETFCFVGSGKPKILKEFLIDIGNQFRENDLLKFGSKKSDGFKYEFSWFDTSNLSLLTGFKPTKIFTERISEIIKK